MKTLQIVLGHRIILLLPYPLPNFTTQDIFEELLGRAIWNEIKGQIEHGREDFFQLRIKIE